METVNRILQEKITARIAPNKAVLIFGARHALKMMNTFVDTLDDTDVMEMQGDLTSGQRAYWESVIERDVRDRNKTKNYLTLDEFEQKLTAAAIKLYA